MVNNLNTCKIIEIYTINDLYKGLEEGSEKCKAFIIMNNIEIKETIKLKKSEKKYHVNEVRFMGNPDIQAIWDQDGKYVSGVRIDIEKDIELDNIFDAEGMVVRISNLVLDGGHKARLLNINSSDDNIVLEVSNSLLINGKARKGGAILSLGGIKIDGSAFAKNYGFESGGAICASASVGYNNLDIKNTLFTDNASNTNGGAINTNLDILLNVKNTMFNKNKSANGGAISVHSGKLQIESSFFDENESTKLAAAIYVKESSKTVLYDTEFRENRSFYYGPIMLGFHGAEVNIDKCTFYENFNKHGEKAKTKEKAKDLFTL